MTYRGAATQGGLNGDDVASPGLAPCPFCGSSSIDPEGWASTDRSGPACDDCRASADTVAIWNTRPEEKRMREMLAAQTAQHAYPCSPHCAGYLRASAMEAECERLRGLTQFKAMCGALEDAERLRTQAERDTVTIARLKRELDRA